MGSPLRIDFGRAKAGVIAAVERLKGARPASRKAVPGCGEVVRWPDGLALIFVAGTFRGWVQDDRSAGVVCG